MSKSYLISGAKVQCYINGQLVGRVNAFRWSADSPHKSISAIDCPVPFELAPGTTKVTGSVGLFRTSGDGGIENMGIQPKPNNIARGKYFTLQLIEKMGGTTLFEANYCVVQNQSWAVDARGVMSGTFSFEGIIWANDSTMG
jgi:hypothetical protein